MKWYTTVNDEQVGMWKVAVMTYFNLLFYNYPGVTEENHEQSQYDQFLHQDSNSELLNTV
jgi:hypothetical protein